jgi:hypothetical protein
LSAVSAPRRVLRTLAALVLAVLVCAGCRIDTEVAIDVHDDGSGTVTLTVTFDADAVSRVPDLAAALRTDDLVAAGWTVTGPTRAEGAVTYVVAKPFRSAAELPGVLAELTGPDGYFRDVQLTRSRAFAATTWTFAATADLSKGVAALTDTQVGTALGGKPLGRDPAALEAELGGPLASFLTGAIAVTMPGPAEANTPTVQGRTARWTVQVGDPAPHRLEASSRHTALVPRVWAGVAGVAAFVLVMVLVVRAMRRRRPILRAVDGGTAI